MTATFRQCTRTAMTKHNLTISSFFKKKSWEDCTLIYRKDAEPLYHSLASLLTSIYPLPAVHSLLVTLYVMEYLIGINKR